MEGVLTAQLSTAGLYCWCVAQERGEPSALVTTSQAVYGPSGAVILGGVPAAPGRVVDVRIVGLGLEKGQWYFFTPEDTHAKSQRGSERCRAKSHDATLYAAPPVAYERLTDEILQTSFVHRNLLLRAGVTTLCYRYQDQWVSLMVADAHALPWAPSPSPESVSAGAARASVLWILAAVFGALVAVACLWLALLRHRNVRRETRMLRMMDEVCRTGILVPTPVDTPRCTTPALTPRSGYASTQRSESEAEAGLRGGLKQLLTDCSSPALSPRAWLFDLDFEKVPIVNRHLPSPSSFYAQSPRGSSSSLEMSPRAWLRDLNGESPVSRARAEALPGAQVGRGQGLWVGPGSEEGVPEDAAPMSPYPTTPPLSPDCGPRHARSATTLPESHPPAQLTPPQSPCSERRARAPEDVCAKLRKLQEELAAQGSVVSTLRAQNQALEKENRELRRRLKKPTRLPFKL